MVDWEITCNCRQEVEREFQAPQIPTPKESVTHEDYNIPDFIPSEPIYTAVCLLSLP